MISPLRLLHTLAWLPALVLPSRPQDTPCVTWKQSQCNFVSDIANYVPAILSAWHWFPAAGGHCTPCSGQAGSFDCAYLFPCFGDGPDLWGHKDVASFHLMGPCNIQLPNGTETTVCNEWLPGKGPEWQHFGWQLAQNGSRPDQAAGQLIEYGGYVLSRSPAAVPFAGCVTPAPRPLSLHGPRSVAG